MTGARAAIICALAGLLVAPAACGAGDDPRGKTVEAADLGGGAVARVGATAIAAETVSRIAAAQGVSNVDARARAIRDALFAEEARARGVDPAPLEATVLSRAMLGELRAESQGPVRDDELETVTERHRYQLRRPAGVRVVHALVRPKPGFVQKEATETERQRSDEVAAAIREAVGPAVELAARTPQADEDPVVAEFQRLASAVPADGLEVRVEALPPLAADGRIVSREGGEMVRVFAEEVWSLGGRGALSRPFRSSFGTHVALVLERTQPVEVSAERRRSLVAPEVIDDRIRARRHRLLESGASQVELPPNVAALLDLVRVQ